MRTVVACLLGLIATSTAATADEVYVFVEGGVGWSFDRSNSDEVEFGDEPGGTIAVGLGRRFVLDDRFTLGVEGQAIGQGFPLHGRNDRREATADGRAFWLAGATANVWPEMALDERWSLYAGGGLGPAAVTAFGDTNATLLLIGGGGVRWRATDRVAVDAGGRYYWTLPVELDGARSGYDSFGPSFRLMWMLP